MHWIALLPPEDERLAWSWRALRFTPRVAQVDEALLLEVSSCARLWGGQARLMRWLLRGGGLQPVRAHAQGGTSLLALALMRRSLQLEGACEESIDELPLDVLTAALPHVALLERMGCRTWGALRALPRGGVSRRFGGQMVGALDAAWGDQPETYPWLAAPEVFDARLELPALVTTAPELMWATQRLLSQLQAWLAARQRGVLALELEWTLDLKRLNGVNLPQHEQLVLRTAQPTQSMSHLRRLAGEQLSRATLSAPANWLRMRSLETVPWAGASTSLLPEDNVKGERLHQLIERLSARLGDDKVLVPLPHSDHRPEKMQRWVPARQASAAQPQVPAADPLFPPWLLKTPLLLKVKNNQPQYGGSLHLERMWRVETAWWEGRPALRDYYIANSPQAGLVWVFRERVKEGSFGSAPEHEQERWFLQGLYA